MVAIAARTCDLSESFVANCSATLYALKACSKRPDLFEAKARPTWLWKSWTVWQNKKNLSQIFLLQYASGIWIVWISDTQELFGFQTVCFHAYLVRMCLKSELNFCLDLRHSVYLKTESTKKSVFTQVWICEIRI